MSFLLKFAFNFTKVITINDLFPGPLINASTNDNVHIKVYNDMDEPLLLTWYTTLFIFFFFSFKYQIIKMHRVMKYKIIARKMQKKKRRAYKFYTCVYVEVRCNFSKNISNQISTYYVIYQKIFLTYIHWSHRNGIQQRLNSWQDGVSGTNCPILPGTHWTYVFQMKDQIGSFFYFPSINFQKAGGGFGPIRINNRIVINVPFPKPQQEFDLLIGDWYGNDYKVPIIC